MSRTKSKNRNTTADTLLKDVETLRDDVAELALDARKYARQKFSGLSESVRESTGEALERSRDVVGNECDRALDYARQNPLATLSFGLLAGFVFGALACGRGD